MPVAASDVFRFLSQHEALVIERHEVALAAFSVVRRNVRRIALGLYDADDQEAQEVSDSLRARLSEWLTVPLPFDDEMLHSIETALGDSAGVGRRWGSEILRLYDEVRRAAERLAAVENPLRTDVQAALADLHHDSTSFRILCHRRARKHYETLGSSSGFDLAEGIFLHSAADYRSAEPFEVLIKVGPLRSRGWGSAPDAVVTAPRFAKMLQFVWSGCEDESGFGYDPARAFVVAASSDKSDTSQAGTEATVRRVTRVGDDVAELPDRLPDIDEFHLFQQCSRGLDRRRAVLIQIDDDHGMLNPPFSEVLSFDPDTACDHSIARRKPNDTLAAGMFVILPIIGEVDFGGSHVADGRFSREWKAKLRQELNANPDAICRLLRLRGVRHVSLRACVEYWSRFGGTVIHAPQNARDFEILIDILGMQFSTEQSSSSRLPWWQYAWAEICRSRGVAIQTGQQKSDILDEELLEALNSSLPDIRGHLHEPAFSLGIPAGRSVRGTFRFFKVTAIEDGFVAPESSMKQVMDLETLDEWRV